ncbi:hypothetical protein Kalk_00955 [Ketobacter alkanivorans]|uniref:Uncharacterized protein n=1 Tax=Ketobacter alkanivorans TaxID=1917421 RepID=A0A2K9LFE1_9GAMM|nr:hypothetical protein Kalk_00955 [Ketobacter alkanivorans]
MRCRNTRAIKTIGLGSRYRLIDQHYRSNGGSGCAMEQFTIITIITSAQTWSYSFVTAFTIKRCRDLFIRFGSVMEDVNRHRQMIHIGVINGYR